VEFALGHPQLGKDFGKYLQSLSRETINSIAAKGNEYAQVERRKGIANGNGGANGHPVAKPAKPAVREVKASRRKGATA
jgi:hypothetical protein